MFNKKGYLIALLSILFLVFVVGVIRSQEGTKPPNGENQTVRAQVSRDQLDTILAKDLALTSSLFIRQLDEQLKEWSQFDGTDEILKKQISKELNEHPHFHAAALIEGDELQFYTEEFHQEKINLLQLNNEQQMIYSDPYLIAEQPFMLIARRGLNERWLVGEVDLGFVKRFVGELAAITDANGHFFVGGEAPEVKVGEKKGKMTFQEARVPEVDWTVKVQSKTEDDPAKKSHFHEGEVLVRFSSDNSAELWLAEHRHFEVVKRYQNIYVLRHQSLSTREIINQLQDEQEILWVEPNNIYTKQETDSRRIPNDEFFDEYQWNLSQINAEAGWQLSAGGEDVIIAILDTGIDMNHPDLREKIIDGYNVFADNDDVTDEHGHGTHVAGIAAAITNNERGIAGLSWQNPIMPVKVLNEEGEGGLFEVVSGIYWATDQGAQVINLSLGDDESSELLHEAIRYAYDRNVVLVAASGNDNVGIPMYPAAYPEVLAVGAVNQRNEKAPFSNYGTYLDVTAPGEHIPSTFSDQQYVFMSGTSMSAPHVTGLAALIRSRYPELSNRQVMNVIRQTADDLGPEGFDDYYGYGQINVYQALLHLEQGKEIKQFDVESDRDSPVTQVNRQAAISPYAIVKKWLGQLLGKQ